MNRKNYFTADVEVALDGKTLRFSLKEQNDLVSPGNYWHGEGDPSTWLSVSAFEAVRRKYPEAAAHEILAVAAQALGVTPAALVASIRWHENYMRWHDGDHDYQVLTPDDSNEKSA